MRLRRRIALALASLPGIVLPLLLPACAASEGKEGDGSGASSTSDEPLSGRRRGGGDAGAGAVDAGTIDDLMPLASGDTHSSLTPLGIHFEGAATHVITATERAFLADATKSPPIPGSTVGLHLRRFAVDLYPSGAPVPADVDQHVVGDCDGDAVLASMAYVAPHFVERLVDDRHDGTFGVAMFEPSGKPLTVAVDSRFLADGSNELAAVSGKSGQADWATVLEKAVMKYDAVFHVVSDISGIGSELLTPMFTGDGDSFAFAPGVLTAAQIARVVRVSLARGKFITGGFDVVLTLKTVTTVVGHGYTVLLPSIPTAMVSMRNPWGASPMVGGGYDAKDDGVLDVPAAALWRQAVDLRIIEPGAAAGGGVTHATHALPHPAPTAVPAVLRIGEAHAHLAASAP